MSHTWIKIGSYRKKHITREPQRTVPCRSVGSEELDSERGLDDKTQLRGKQGSLGLVVSLSEPKFAV